MRSARPNQKGFISIETFLIIVVLALVGGTGYFVYKATKKTNDTFSAAAKAAESQPLAKGSKDSNDGTAGWITYTSSDGKYSLRYPASWKTAARPEACSPDIFLTGPDTDSVGICGSDGLGQIVFSSTEGEQVGAYGGENLTITSKKDVTVDGVKGQRYAATYAVDIQGIGYPKGTIEVTYLFSTNGRTYRATYDREPSGPLSNDALADFDLIVTKTLKFQ